MTVIPKFRKATRFQTKASILIDGTSGEGKSGLALTIAAALTDSGDNIFAIDTENRALDLFAGLTMHTGDKFPDFNKVDLTDAEGFKPTTYRALQNAAIEEGADVIIVDSLTHCWQRTGGVLDMVTKISKTNKGGSFNAWGDDAVVAEKNMIFELVRHAHAHIISTVRVKEKVSMEKNEEGKATVVSLGEKQLQSEDLRYEPDLVLTMISPGLPDGTPPRVLVTKSRYAIFEKDKEYLMTKELITSLARYLNEGVDPHELLEQQRLDYITAIRTRTSSNATSKALTQTWLKRNNFEGAKLEDLPYAEIRNIYMLIAE